MPAGPDDADEPGLALAGRGVEQVLELPQLLVAADERRLERVGPVAAAALRDDAQGAPGRDGAGLALERLLARRLERRSSPQAARWVASPTSTVPGGAARLEPAAVLTMSPATMPWFVAPMVTAASPVRTPARAWMPAPRRGTASTSSRPARTARSASSSCATGRPRRP